MARRPILAVCPAGASTADPDGWVYCPGAPALRRGVTASYPAATVGRRLGSAAAVGSAGLVAGSPAVSVAAVGGARAAWVAAAGGELAADGAASGDASSNRAAHTKAGRHSSDPNNRRG